MKKDIILTYSTLSKTMSYTKTAAQLGISIGTVTNHINELEKTYGIKLISRNTRQVEITPKGKDFLIICDNILNEFDRLLNLKSESKHQEEINIDAPITLIKSITRIIKKITQRYPELKIQLNSNDSPSLISGSKADILFSHKKIENSKMIQKKIAHSKTVYCASHEYLDIYGTPTHPNELLSHKLIGVILPNHATSFAWVLEKGEQKISMKPKDLITNTVDIALSMCSDGLGITSVFNFSSRTRHDDGHLAYILDDWSIPGPILYARYNPENRGSEIINLIIKESILYFNETKDTQSL